MVTTIFSAILGIIQAIPIVSGWVEKFIAWYVDAQIDKMSVENHAAIKKAIVDKDQRDLEKVVGNPNAGEISGLPGTVVRDKLPGVPDAPGN